MSDGITFAAPWIERKVRAAVAAHKRRHPTLNDKRLLLHIAAMDAKTQAWAAYQPVTLFTKRIQKASPDSWVKTRHLRHDAE